MANAATPKNPAGDEISTYLKRAYINYHGNDQGLADIITQTASSVNPPDGFKVAAMEVPTPTGNQNVDAYNTMTFPLKLGGEIPTSSGLTSWTPQRPNRAHGTLN